jgi:hypothetical protein
MSAAGSSSEPMNAIERETLSGKRRYRATG